MTDLVRDDQNSIRLSEMLFRCKRFVEAADNPLRLFPLSELSEENFEAKSIEIKKACHELQLTAPLICHSRPLDTSSLDLGLSRYLNFSDDAYSSICASGESKSDSKNEADRHVRCDTINCVNDRQLHARSVGLGVAGTILIAPPCGVPIAAMAPIAEMFSDHYRVVTWESSTLFSADPLAVVGEHPADEVAEELIALVESLKLGRSPLHIVAVCGGATPALIAAAKLGSRVNSLVICHGDVSFGPESPQTSFKSQFSALLNDALSSDLELDEIYETFLDPGFALSVHPGLGPFVLFPYARKSLFRQYAKINGALMVKDVTPFAAEVSCPTLVLTSSTDRMAHPDSSLLLSSKIENCRLVKRDSGEHLDILLGDQSTVKPIVSFISDGMDS